MSSEFADLTRFESWFRFLNSSFAFFMQFLKELQINSATIFNEKLKKKYTMINTYNIHVPSLPI